MISSEWVVRSLTFSTYPTRCCCFSYLSGSALVVAFVVRSVWLGVRSVPCLLASCAALCCGECSAGQAGSLDWHWSQVSGWEQVGQVGWVMVVSVGVSGCSSS